MRPWFLSAAPGRTRPPTPGPWIVPGALAVLVLLFLPAVGFAQEPPDTLPPRPDSVLVTDTIPLPGDSLAPADSILILADTLVADSLRADSLAADSAGVVRVLPLFPEGQPAGFSQGVWEWGPEELIATRAFTVAELLDQIPGMTLLRGGDYGMPTSASSFGLGGGRMAVYFDGLEIPPMEGGVPDLSRIEMSGIGRIRVVRRLGGTRIELFSRIWEEPRPYSVVQAGTGDLDTNVFGFTYVDADALRGSLGVSLDRIDTDGPGREFPSTVSGFWGRYALHFGDRGGIQIQARRRDTRRGDVYFPDGTRQTDLAGRIRFQFTESLLAETYISSHTLDLVGPLAESEIPDDSLRFSTAPRHQAGGRVAFERSGFFVDTELKLHGGRGWAERVFRVSGGMDGRRWGGLAGSWEHEAWQHGPTGGTLQVNFWTPTVAGLKGFAEYENSKRGVPEFGLRRTYLPEFSGSPDAILDTLTVPHFTDRSGFRIGGEFSRGRLNLGGALLRVEADSLAVLGLATDRDGLYLPGGERSGWEAYAGIPLYFDGLSLVGSLTSWSEDELKAWRYMPRRVWDGALRYHGQFRPSGNLEVTFSLGVKGRDGMLVPFLAPPEEDLPAVAAVRALEGEEGEEPLLLDSAPFYQSWYAHLDLRIVTVRAFLRVENLQNRVENRDFPGTFLPTMRTMYGIRWVLFN